MAEARKSFPIDTFAAYLKGDAAEGYSKAVLDLLSHVTQKNVDEDFQLFAASLAKAWIYEQHPELIEMAGHELSKFGENVSITPLPEDVMGLANAVFTKIDEYKATIAEQNAKIAELEKNLAAAEKEAGPLKAKLDEYTKKEAAGEQKIVASKDKVDEYLSKVDDLLAKIEEVKKHGVVTVSGEGGAAAPSDSGADSGDTSGPGEDFGFGSTAASSGDDFGF